MITFQKTSWELRIVENVKNELRENLLLVEHRSLEKTKKSVEILCESINPLGWLLVIQVDETSWQVTY